MNNRVLGARGEGAAAEFLLGQGCRMVARNYRTKFGEVDLVVLDRGCLCFVEVKSRKSYQAPQEAVSIIKQKKLTQLAKMYLSDHYGNKSVRCRFDVIAFEENGLGVSRIEWFKNAFDAVD